MVKWSGVNRMSATVTVGLSLTGGGADGVLSAQAARTSVMARPVSKVNVLCCLMWFNV
jgi:hypothetical protein